VIPAGATQLQQQCSPGRKGSRVFGGHKQNTGAAHTGYTGQRLGSSDDMRNTTFTNPSFFTLIKACSAGFCLDSHSVSVAAAADLHPGFVPRQVESIGADRQQVP
jgi:hypothetical protein